MKWSGTGWLKATVIAATFLTIGTASAQAVEGTLTAATAENVLLSCRGKKEWDQGFCTGFIEAIAVRLAESRKSCAYWPVEFGPLVDEALDALAEADPGAPAWKVVEQRLSEKHLPPCK